MEGGGRKRCLVSGEGDFSFTCHVALQMVTLLGSSGSPLPELTPLTWGWGGRDGGWRRMAPVGGGGGGRGRRKEGLANQPAGWWISLLVFPTLALSPAAAAAATTATAAAAAAGQATPLSKWRRLAWPVTSPGGRSRRPGPEGRGGARAGARSGGGGAGSGPAGSWPRPFPPRPAPSRLAPPAASPPAWPARSLSQAVPPLPALPVPVRGPAAHPRPHRRASAWTLGPAQWSS